MEPQTIRTTARKPSPYRFKLMTENSPQHGRLYAVENTKNSRTWIIAGHSPEVVSEHAYADPPAYVLARIEQEWSRDVLRDTLPVGSTVYTTLNHVGRMGTSRRIGVRAIVDNEPQYLDGLVSLAIGRPYTDDGIRMDGGGMDMGFALAYELAHALYPQGFDCIDSALDNAHKCPSNDHSNPGGKRGPDVHHNDGGYALRHRWL